MGEKRMSWNWLGWILWIGGIAFLVYVIHYIRVHQLMMIARDHKRFSGRLFVRYIILLAIAIAWLCTMGYFSFFRSVSYKDSSAVSIHTTYHPLVLTSAHGGYYYVVANRTQGGKKDVVSYTYWTKNAKNTTNARYGTLSASDRYLSSVAGEYPWNKQKLQQVDRSSGYAFAAVMTIRYKNTPINGLGVRAGRQADQYTLIRVPAANMIYQK